MVYNSQVGVIVPHMQKIKKQLTIAVAAIFIAPLAAMTLSASAATVNNCNIDKSGAVTWTLQADCTSSAQINIPAGVTFDGGGHTISPEFSKTDADNNAGLGIVKADGVSIRNVTIDGSKGIALHGINVYQSANVAINNVTVKNANRGGIVVNGSTVAVSEVTTSGSGWYGIDVDKTGAILNVTGTMHQTDNAQLYVDDINVGTVNDVLKQYNVMHVNSHGTSPNDALYTLKTILGSKSECKKGGWATSENPVYKNQGQCVSHFASNGKNAR